MVFREADDEEADATNVFDSDSDSDNDNCSNDITESAKDKVHYCDALIECMYRPVSHKHLYTKSITS
jgi:hypothetical protein